MLVHGQSVPSLGDDELFEMRRQFGVLFQDGALFGSLNLYDNVAFPLRQHTEKGDEEIAEIVNQRLREVGLGGEGEKMPNELSGGMRKRAGFARALVLDPRIVLFDEPDSGLDPVRTALLCELIKEVHAENGGCYVVITHDIMSARRVAEHISVLWKGRIVESGPGARSCSPRRTRSCASSSRANPQARWAWTSARRALLARLASPAGLAFACERGKPSSCASRRGDAPAAAGYRGRARARLGGSGSSPCACIPSAATDTFVSRSSAEYRATQRFYRNFGEEPVQVVVKGNLQQLLFSSDIDRLVGLEGCLAGNVPAAALAQEGGVDGPCGQLARAKTVKVVARSRHLHQRGGEPDRRTADQRNQACAHAGQAGARRDHEGGDRAGIAPAKHTRLANRRAS